MKKVEAYAYLRVSGKEQIFGNGFDRQLKTIEQFCNVSQYKISKIYEEQVSGTEDEKNRPEMSLMIADITSNGCNTIIVEDLSRLAREYRVQENIILYLAARKINLVAANTGENVTEAIASDPMRKALVQVQGVFGELDKSLLVMRLRRAREKVRHEQGRCEGAKPYGTLAGEAQIVRRIKLLRRRPKKGGVNRRTYQSIAEQLNREGARPRRGEKWTASLVYNVCKTS
jgi:site-specific DNA recombinase